jgi:hypothetical protein
MPHAEAKRTPWNSPDETLQMGQPRVVSFVAHLLQRVAINASKIEIEMSKLEDKRKNRGSECRKAQRFPLEFGSLFFISFSIIAADTS